MIQFIKTILFAIKKKYGYYAQELGDSQMSSLSQGVQNKQSDSPVSNVPIFPSEGTIQKVIKAYQEEIKKSEQIGKRTRRSVQSMDKTEVRKERASKVRDVQPSKTNKGDAKRTLRKSSTQSNKVGRRKLPPAVRGL